MKVGKLPLASIVLVVLVLTSLIMNRLYPGQYYFDSPFIEGGFFGAALVYLLYYINIWIRASAKNKEEADHNSAA